MEIAEDIRRIALQEQRLSFPAFDAETAWALGVALKTAAEAKRAPIVIDIRLYAMRLVSFALPGAKPENFDWARRKRNSVFRFQRSSYAMGRKLQFEGKTLHDLGALPERDFAVHGGSFPIQVDGAGCIGAVTVSGLPQRDDHTLVVDALARVLEVDVSDIALA
jgi:uncharacterized protein (UPF0303 family)